VAQRSRFAGDSEVDGGRCVQYPGVIEVQVWHLGTHSIGIREARILIFGSVAREGACLTDCLTDCFTRDVGGARVSLAATTVDGDSNTTIVGVLEVLHVAEPGCRGETHVMADRHLGLIDAASLCFSERAGDDIFELLRPERFSCL
jgi:hypothetical protein